MEQPARSPFPEPTAAERRYLKRGLAQPGGKLPLFDRRGQAIDRRIVEACMAKGLAEPWFSNPMKADWIVCKLTPAGYAAAGGEERLAARGEGAGTAAPT